MKSVITPILLLCLAISSWSQTFTFTGQVTFAGSGDPAPFFGISAFLSTGDPQNVSDLTDADGQFEIVFNIDPDAPDSLTSFFFTYVDPCSGQVQIDQAFFPPDQTSFSTDITICPDVNPPGQPDTCGAVFAVQSQPGSFDVDFFNLSFGSPPIDSVVWDFGDGTTSNDPGNIVTHTYADYGLYLAGLTVFSSASGCSSTYTELLAVLPQDSCDCSGIPYDPVCAITASGDSIAFDNACQAACLGFDSTEVFDCYPDDDDCICPDIWAPVCVVDSSGYYLQFGNACEAECAGFDSTTYFSCDTTGCGCEPVLEPVCVDLGNGQIAAFSNECIALCLGFDSTQLVNCVDHCICPTEYDPVCVTTSQGDTLTFDNFCWAQCNGFDSTDLVTCSGCLCPDVHDPVCVDNGDGTYQTFENACEAECAGFDSTDLVACDSIVCDCPDIFDPVCIEVVPGEFFLFPNACFAFCLGFDTTDIQNCSDFPNCFADFTYFADPGDPLTLTFTDSSFADSPLTGWAWDFGDGNTATGPQVTHTYDQPGNYFVTLTITSADSCINAITYHIIVGGGGPFDGPDCSAMFSFQQLTDSTGTVGFPFQFTDLSMGNPDSWFWDFGDGSTSTQQNPLHTYAEPGLYWVRLTIQDSACTDELSILIIAGSDDQFDDDCQALFTGFFAPDSLTVIFLNLSTAASPIVSYEWDFGDGNTSTEVFPVNTYEFAAVYIATLTITTADGCTSTFEMTINLETQTMEGRAANLLTSTAAPAPADIPVRLFPNPVAGQLQLEFQMEQPGEARYRIFNPEGRQVRSQSLNLGSGAQRLEIPVSELPAGMYFLQLQHNGRLTTTRFVKR